MPAVFLSALFIDACEERLGDGAEFAARGKHNRGCMSPLNIFGFFALTAMLVCYALEKRSKWYILAFAVACGLGAAYGFLQGAWPFGLVETVWFAVAVRRWWLLEPRS